MALNRKLRVGDRFMFPDSTHDPKQWPSFTGTVIETHANDGIVWFRDDKTGESSCFIAWFRDGKTGAVKEYNALACHVDE